MRLESDLATSQVDEFASSTVYLPNKDSKLLNTNILSTGNNIILYNMLRSVIFQSKRTFNVLYLPANKLSNG